MDWDLVIIFAFVLALVALRTLGPSRGARTRSSLGQTDQAALDRALDQARRLEERIDSLERVLDEDMPGWRRRVSA